MTTLLLAMILVLIASFIASLGSIFLKKGAAKISGIKTIITNYSLITGILFYGISTVFFVPALRGGELSVLYPLVSTGYIWTCLLSIKLLGEKMNRYKWISIAFIVLGISFIGIGS